MIWVAWRQFRTQALVTLGLLVAFAGLVVVTGLHLHHVYSSLGGARCQSSNDCTDLVRVDRPVADLLWPALFAIPLLLGMFWGAPLVGRELESGTYRLAWTQSVTRRRWLSVRVALVTVAALAVAGLASWLVSWWYAPLDAVNQNSFDPSVFGARGVLAVGYAGFAVALGVAAGALTRRTLPAMASTLAGFAGVRIAFTLWIRPHLLPARHMFASITTGKGVAFVGSRWGLSVAPGAPPVPNSWLISSRLVEHASNSPTIAQLHVLIARVCPAIANPTGGGKGAGKGFTPAAISCTQALSRHLQSLVVYQPRSHYWPLQALETGIYLAAALALIGATIWRLGRRARPAPAPALSESRERTVVAVEVAPGVGVPPARRSEDTQQRHRRLPTLNRHPPRT